MSVTVHKGAAVISIACGCVLAVISFSVKRIRNRVYPFFLAGALILGGALFTAEYDYDLKYALSFADGDFCEVKGIVTDYPSYSSSRYYYTVNTTEINGKKCETTLRLSCADDLGAEPYDTLSGNLSLYYIGRSAGEDMEWHFRSKGVYLGAYADRNNGTLKTESLENKPLRYRILQLRREIESRVLSKLPNEYGGTAVALLLGDKTYISDETQNLLYETGVAPVFAVSGFHLSVWIMGLYEFLRQIQVRKRTGSAICIAMTVLFMALTGFSPSVCRSGLMMLLFLAGNLTYRRTDSLNSLGFAALVLCCINPFIVANTGFLMSFSATLGIVTLNPLAEKYITPKIKYALLKGIAGAVIVSVCAVLGSLPVMVIRLEYVAVFSVITNLLVTYMAAVCMILAGITTVLFKISFLSDFTAFISGIAAKYILFIVRLFGKIPVKSVSTADIFWKGGMIVCLAVILFSISAFKGKTAFKFSCVGISITVAVSTVLSVFDYDGLTQVDILNVGDGIAVTSSYEGRKILLLGGSESYGASYTVKEKLDEISRKPANMFYISDCDCMNSLQILKENRFNRLIISEENRTVSTFIPEDKILVSPALSVNIWDGGNIEYCSRDDGSYAFCTFDTVKILIIFSADKDTYIREKYSTGDILVCRGYIPENISPCDFDLTVISTTKKKSQTIYNYVKNKGGKAVTTNNLGNLSVKIRNGEYKISAKEE